MSAWLDHVMEAPSGRCTNSARLRLSCPQPLDTFFNVSSGRHRSFSFGTPYTALGPKPCLVVAVYVISPMPVTVRRVMNNIFEIIPVRHTAPTCLPVNLRENKVEYENCVLICGSRERVPGNRYSRRNNNIYILYAARNIFHFQFV